MAKLHMKLQADFAKNWDFMNISQKKSKKHLFLVAAAALGRALQRKLLLAALRLIKQQFWVARSHLK